MCGIAGIISGDPRRVVTDGVLRAMAARVAHRGPDGEGVFLNRPGPAAPGRAQAGLAFRRLAVLDCDARAMQPMTTPDGRFTVVFNGEIYNFRGLRARLPGRDWRTSGDTEVLLAALAEWGPDAALERLEGMFAIALWDEREQTLLLARDRMGQKPLYYATGGGESAGGGGAGGVTVAFASEPAALGPWPHWDRATDDDALAHYLRYGYVLAPASIYRGARQVGPGGRLVVRFGPREAGATAAVDGRRWFTGESAAPAPFTPRRADETRAVIETAVRRQLVSDVPLGVFLSGGVDSGVIALAARRATAAGDATGGGTVRTFSVGFDDPRYDETPYAEAVAAHLGTAHRTFRLTAATAAGLAEDLPALAANFGEPFADSSALPTHWLSQQTRTQVTVALSGDGGDELFGGYDRYRAAGWPVGLLRPLAPLGRRLARGHPKARRTRAGRLLASAGLPAGRRYAAYVSLFNEADVAALLGRDPPDDRPAAFDGLLARTGGPVEAALAFDRRTYLPGDLLTKVDRCSMRHALEVRSPFMDTGVVQFAASLRRPQLLGGGPKRLLREAFAADLPPFVFTRRKAGFAVPVGEWFRGPLRPMLRDCVFAGDGFCRGHFDFAVVERLAAEHDSGRREHGQRLYALLMLELWWRSFRTWPRA